MQQPDGRSHPVVTPAPPESTGRIRVLRALNAFDRGGIDRGVLAFLEHYDRRLLEVDVMCVGRSVGVDAPAARDCGAQLLHCPKSASTRLFARRVARQLRGRRYHVVVSNLSLMGAGVLRGARDAGVPVRVAGFHSTRPNTLATLSRNTLLRPLRHLYLEHLRGIVDESATAFYCVGREVERAVSSTFRVGARSLRTLYRGFNLDAFQFVPPEAQGVSKRRLGIAPHEVVVGHVGSFRPEKNHDLFLASVAAFRRRVPDACALCVGDGALLRHAVEYARRLGVKLVAPGNLADVAACYAAMDLFLFPSSTEGVAGAVVEAQAAGLLPLCSNIPGAREALAPALHGMMFDARLDGPESIAERLLALYRTDPAQAGALRSEASWFVRERFGIARHCRAFEEWLRPLAAETTGSGAAVGVAAVAGHTW